MPRRLPWKTGGAGAGASPSRAAQSHVPSSSPLAAPSSQRSPRRTPKRKANRSPSASPPPPPTAPPELFIRPATADDSWRLVEDELLAAAQAFTQHLHHAEYQRQKSLARARKALEPRPDTVLRGLGGASSEHVRAKQRERVTAKGRDGVKKIGALRREGAEGGTGLEEDGWLGTGLAGLLARKDEDHLARPVGLVGLQGIRGDTRAARGFGKPAESPKKAAKGKEANRAPVEEPEEYEDEDRDDDDLDASPARRKDPHLSLQRGQGSGRDSHESNSATHGSRTRPERDRSPRRKHPPAAEATQRPDMDAARPLRPNKIARIPIKRERSEKESSMDVNEIPMFLA